MYSLSYDSDGVWDFADDETVIETVIENMVCRFLRPSRSASLIRACVQGKPEEQIARLILDVARKQGSEDDITVIVAKITY